MFKSVLFSKNRYMYNFLIKHSKTNQYEIFLTVKYLFQNFAPLINSFVSDDHKSTSNILPLTKLSKSH